MRRILKLIVLLLLLPVMTSCGTNKSGIDNINRGNSADQVIGERIEDKKTTEKKKSNDRNTNQISEHVDYDFTAMSSDMVYATVWQMMIEPDEYVGKTVRMKGLYYAAYYEPTAQYYHYCVIQDAMACCAQGIKFVWDDGSHIYPDEYPEVDSEIIVQGTFETYKEKGNKELYYQLKNASIEVK